MVRTRMSPAARRQELVHAAARAFSDRGVGQTAISDIVAAAGVAQGTFYLYFESKTDVVNAVVEQMSERVVGGVIALADEPNMDAVTKLLRMRDALLSTLRSDRDLLAFFHRAGNEAFHDRVSRDAVRRIVPAMERVIEQGCAERVFKISHPDDAALFLAALMDVTDPFGVFAEPERLEHHVEALTEFMLRGLGCDDQTLARELAIVRDRVVKWPAPPSASAPPQAPRSQPRKKARQ